MAIGVPTFSFFGRPRPRGMHGGRGLKSLGGSVLLDAGNSAWTTSGIEKTFRRCHGINFVITDPVTSGYHLQWKRSTTHKAGVLNIYVQSALSTTGTANPFVRSSIATTTCALFTAVGV